LESKTNTIGISLESGMGKKESGGDTMQGQKPKHVHHDRPSQKSGALVSRREFIKTAGTSVAAFAILRPELLRGTRANSKIKLGLVGCGGRGVWIAGLFAAQGGYEIFAGADYFADRVGAFGAKFSVPPDRLFSGLSGYKRLLDCGVEAVAIETPPYFHPEQAAAAVDKGIHVYLAKPLAVDVPGCRMIAGCGKKATARKLAFLVDFQTRAHPAFIEALRRVRDGALGESVFGEATYHAESPWEEHYEMLRNDPANPEVRLRAWGLDRTLSGDIITEQEIHALDVANWIMEKPPLWAVGTGGLKARPKVGSCWDHFVVYYQYADDVAIQFSGRQFKGHGTAEGIKNRMFGSRGILETEYGGTVVIRGENFFNGGRTPEIYESGAVNNIAAFHESITKGNFMNPTVEPSVQSNLITILGRKAAYEKRRVTWDDLVQDEEKLEPSLEGLLN
jgi:myo-inositol 2-dehydrogenase/D-chiro-inositol 1-dehydrogenase